MAVDEELSPAVQQQMTKQGTRLHGFEKARASMADFGYDFTSKCVERQTERIGAERVAERDAVVEHFEGLTLMEKCEPPAGVAITSCHIESTIKQINYRVKGSEMFWTDDGAEALLQLSADLLCDSAPLDGLWSRRAAKMTGTRAYHCSKT